jgi:hypothetical protein
MGKQKVEQTTTVPSRGTSESNLLQLLQQLATSGAGQLGDLSALAQGQIGAPTSDDIQLIADSIGRARQLAESQIQASGDVMGSRAREDLASRGVSDSSSEVLSSLLNTLGTQQSVAQSIMGAQQQGGQALMSLPFQRAGVQLGANQQLFNQILGAAAPGLGIPLQERLAQTTTTQETSGFNVQDLAGLAGLGGMASSIPGFGFLNFLNRGQNKTE